MRSNWPTFIAASIATVFAVVVARILFFQILGQGIANVAVIIDDKDMRG